MYHVWHVDGGEDSSPELPIVDVDTEEEKETDEQELGRYTIPMLFKIVLTFPPE